MSTAWVSISSNVFRAGQRDVRLRALCVQKDEENSVEVFAPLLQFFIETNVQKRLALQENMSRAVGLFLTFLTTVGVSESSDMPPQLLQQFVACLLDGTDCAPDYLRELRWKPMPPTRAQYYLSLVTRFSDWWAERTGTRPLNPWRLATPEERMLAARRQAHRDRNSIFQAGIRLREKWRHHARTVSVPDEQPRGRTIKAFKEEAFCDLLAKGFSIQSLAGAAFDNQYRLRDILIALLLHGGGLRISEPFHLWCRDVQADPNDGTSAQVRLYHPIEGPVPYAYTDGSYRNRADYLEKVCKTKPRNQREGRFHAGWKKLAIGNPRTDYGLVHWFPSFYGQLFLSLYQRYIQLRPDGGHPFLFVSEKEGYRGEPYTVASFEQAHGRAVRRAGYEVAKNLGTTPHGHRHAYCRALIAAGLSRHFIRHALHHKSLVSQEAYMEPEDAELRAVLNAATQRMGYVNAFAFLGGQP